MHTIQFALGGLGVASLLAMVATGAALALRSAGLLRPRHLIAAVAITAASWLVSFRDHSDDSMQSNPQWATPTGTWRMDASEGSVGTRVARGWPAPYLYAAEGERERSLHLGGMIADLASWTLLAALVGRMLARMRTSMTGIAILLLAGCGGGAASGPAVANQQPPPPGRGLTVEAIGVETIEECERHDLALRVIADGQIANEVMVAGTCEGACTAEDKAAGEAQIAEIQAAIGRGDATESELDYDFTGCIFYGVSAGRTEEIGGRRVEVLVGYNPGPHGIPNRFFRIATELCGKVFVSDELGATYANRWQLDDLRVAAEGNAVVITVDLDGVPLELYRATFAAGACTAEQLVGDAEGP